MWTHWLCHQHASTRSSPAQIKHWPQKSKKPHGRKSPSHHLLDKNKVTEGRVYWEDKTWKWKAFRLKDCLFISHLTLQTRPSTLLWFPQRASWLPAQSEPTGQETEEQNTEMSHCRATSATSQPIINILTDQNKTPRYLAFYRRLKLKAEIFLLLLKSVLYDHKSFYY